MKKILSAAVLVVLGGVLALVVQRFACSPSENYTEVRDLYKAKIDSLQSVIEQRNRRIIAIEESIKTTENEITNLEKGIHEKDRQINYYKGKGRFDYVQSLDSLHAELNRLIRQRLAEADSTGRTTR